MNLEQVRQTRRARDLFFSGESIVSQWVPEPITRSWERSRRLGLSAGSVAKIVKLEHAWRRLDGRNDDGFQVAPFPG